jgi:hypothetical protein
MMLAGRSETNENENQVLFWKRDFIITESENMTSTAAVALSVPHSRSSPVVSLSLQQSQTRHDHGVPKPQDTFDVHASGTFVLACPGRGRRQA